MENHQQELMFKLSMFEQQTRQLQEQLNAIEQGIVEMKLLSVELEDLKGGEGKEIFAPIGKGIFAKAKLISEDLIVDIGNKTLVKKSISETNELIEEQIEKLKEVQEELDSRIRDMGEILQQTLLETQEQEDKNVRKKKA